MMTLLMGAITFLLMLIAITIILIKIGNDRPEIIYIAAPPPRVYAAIKKALSGFYIGEHHFRIVAADPTKLTLRAVMEWRERVQKELWFYYPQGYRLNQIVLDVFVSLDKERRMTKIQYVWIVYDRFYRGRVWIVQKATKQILDAELSAISSTAYTHKANTKQQ